MSRTSAAWIKTNGTKCWLSLPKLARGEFSFERGSEQDQCDGCGSDLIETGSVSKNRKFVICVECKAEFKIEREDGRGS